MKITWAEAGSIKIMSKFLKTAILLSQVLVPIVHAYKNISVTIDHSYTTHKGSVIVSGDRKFGKICSHYGDSDWAIASVVCRQLGHGPPVDATSVYDAAQTNFFYEQNFDCKGQEKSLSECYNSFPYNEYCSNLFLDVECLPSSSHNFDVRLVAFSTYGTVLVFYGGRWGPVCSSSYDSHLPDVICKELGYHDGMYYYFTYDDGLESYEDPVLYFYSCDSWDSSLDSCSYVAQYSWDAYCKPIAVKCEQYDSTYDDTTTADGMAAGFSVLFFFLIIMCCTGVICCMLCRKKTRQSREPVAMTNLTPGATAPLQPQEPVVHPPPPPYKDVVVGPATDEPPPPVYNPNMGYPSAPAPGFPSAPGPGYPPASGSGYPAADPGYPTAPVSVYPLASGSGYPPAQVPGHHPGPGYPPAPGAGYPSAPGPGYPPAPGPGYPPTSGPGYPTAPGPEHLGSSYPTTTGQGYPSASGSGYPPVSDPGNLPPKSSGYLPGSGTEYQSAPPPSFAPMADDSSRMGQTGGGPPPAGEQSGPSPSAPPPPDVPSSSE